MYQSNLSSDNCFKRFTGETFGTAILNSGASNTMCGGMRIDCYTESLSGKETESLKHIDSKNSVKFGDGRKVKSFSQFVIPAKIGIKNEMIETDVVNEEITFLLSKEIMKKADAETGFNNDLLKMLGEKQDLIITTAGHCAIPSGNKQDIEKLHANININIILMSSH